MTDTTDRAAAVAGDDVAGTPPSVRFELNGAPASADDLHALASLNYGHFTSMRVEDGAVRGLDLHLTRLEVATRELFATTLDVARLRANMRSALRGEAGPVSLRVDVFARALRRDRPSEPVEPDVLVTVRPAREDAVRAARLASYRFERVMPHIKHVGLFGQLHYRRRAQLDGFDDALFVDANGAVSEASVWNIGFLDGTRIVWPDAPALAGISMQLIRIGLRELGFGSESRTIPRGDLARYRAAFLTNSSCAVRPVAAIDDVEFAADPALVTLLERAYASNPWQTI